MIAWRRWCRAPGISASVESSHDGAAVFAFTITQSHLGELSAVRLVVRYTCPGSKDRFVRDSTIALKGQLWVYEVTLYSRAERFDRDAAVMNEVLKSWKYTGSR